MEENQRNQPPPRCKGKDGMISCMCGAPLIHTTPTAAYYSGAQVNCDICGLYCPSNGDIYHCPAEKTKDHPGGYDLCFNCVRYQMRSFHEQQRQQQQPTPKMCEEKEHVVEQSKNTTNKEKESRKKDTVTNSSNTRDPLEGFEYANEARSIMTMGFSDVEKIKFLLISKKGNSDQVIAQLLPQ